MHSPRSLSWLQAGRKGGGEEKRKGGRMDTPVSETWLRPCPIVAANNVDDLLHGEIDGSAIVQCLCGTRSSL